MLYLDRHKRMLMNTGMTVYLMLRFYGKFNYSSLRLMKRVYRGYRKRTEDDFINPTPSSTDSQKGHVWASQLCFFRHTGLI